MKINEVYLFSSNYKLAQKLFYTYTLKAVYAESRHLSKDLFNLCSLWDIPLYCIETIECLDNILPKKTNNALAISYGTGLLFKNRHIDKFKYGIWNIHTGKLPENRGRHPLGWTFINNDKYFTLSIHRINEEIDQGILIYECNIQRDINDKSEDIMKKIDKIIEKDFLEQAIKNYCQNKTKILKKGIYNENLKNKFNAIYSKDYTAKELYSIFKSQSQYGTLTVNDRLYNTCDFYCENLVYSNGDIVECKDSKKVYLAKHTHSIKNRGGGEIT